MQQSEQAPSILLKQNSPFQAALGQIPNGREARDAFKSVARGFTTTAGFAGDPKLLPLQAQLKKLAAALGVLELKSTVPGSELSDAIRNAFGAKPSDVVASAPYSTSVTALKDSLIAIKFLPEEHNRPIEDLTRQLRDLEVVARAAADPAFPGTGAALRRFRQRSVQLPSPLDLRSSLSTLQKQQALEKRRQEEESKRREAGEAKVKLYQRLRAAVEELSAIRADQMQTTVQSEFPAVMPAENLRPSRAFATELGQHQQLGQLAVQAGQAIIARSTLAGAAPTPPGQAAAFERSGISLTSLFPAGRAFRNGVTAFKPEADFAFRVVPRVQDSLSASTRELLKERGMVLAERPLDQIVEALRVETLALSRDLDQLLGRPVQRTLKRYGDTLISISTPMDTVWNSLVVADNYAIPVVPFPMDTRVPRSHGDVKPAGVADLLVVKQQLVRYEGTDVAHIENVLRGEKKTRDHSRRRETEELTFRETEITTSEERELESTSRFEMSRETSETIREDASLKAGLTVSGSYGPSVEFAASAEGSVSRSKEAATKSAASFSQEVTERSARKVTQRVLERSSLRVTNEVIEKNGHSIDNTVGGGHISGVYQWVNKVYQAQMFNYGMRMMYDFMLPEPAAFLIDSLQSAHASATELEKPMPFTLRPDQITESNFHSWVKQYGATDVQPPPEMYKTKSLDYNASNAESGKDYTHSGQITIDDGYQAIFGTAGNLMNMWEDDATVDIVLGSRTHRFPRGGPWLWSTALNNERDSLPFALKSFRVSDIAIAVEVKCQRTDRAMLKWRLETHAKLTDAYKARLAEYEEKLAAIKAQAGVAIRGRNPFFNLELMKDEIKKHCVTVLTEQHFDLFDSVQPGSFGIPQIDLNQNEAEGPYVRFFEQAFEWEQMTWITYPYFWGSKSTWRERIAYDDPDPLFNQFLKAGYCRAVVPVRPGFEGALDHFLTYGEVWNGGPLPAIANPLYLSIADELAERLDRPGEEIPQGAPWLVRIPTSLVHLRPDDKLPAWKQDATGEWVEA